MAERQIDRGRDLLADGSVALDLLPDRFDRGMGTQKTVRQSLVLAQQAEQQVSVSMYGLPNWLASYRAKKITLRAFSVYRSNI